MKILFLSTRAPYPTSTGHFQRTYNTLKQLSKFSEIYFVGFYDKGLTVADQQEVLFQIQKFCSKVIIQSLPAESNKLSLARLLIMSLFTKTPFTAGEKSL